MKKILKKKVKRYSNAVRYFSSELSVYGQVRVDESCLEIQEIFSCPCT